MPDNPKLVSSEPLDPQTPTLVSSEPHEPSFLERMGGWRGVGAAGIRGVSGLASGLLADVPGPGTFLGAGVAGLGEGGAELLEGSDLSPARIATESAIGAVPMGKIVKAGRGISSALKGGLLGAVGEGGRELARGESLNPTSMATTGAIGGVTAGLSSKLLDFLHGRTAQAPAPRAAGWNELTPATAAKIEADHPITLPQKPLNPKVKTALEQHFGRPNTFGEVVSPVKPTSMESYMGSVDQTVPQPPAARPPKDVTGEIIRDQKNLTATRKWRQANIDKASEETQNAENLAKIKSNIANSGLEKNTSFREGLSADTPSGGKLTESTTYAPADKGGSDAGSRGSSGSPTAPLGAKPPVDPLADVKRILGYSDTTHPNVGEGVVGEPSIAPQAPPSAPVEATPPVQPTVSSPLAQVLKSSRKGAGSRKTTQGFNAQVEKILGKTPEPEIAPPAASVDPMDAYLERIAPEGEPSPSNTAYEGNLKKNGVDINHLGEPGGDVTIGNGTAENLGPPPTESAVPDVGTGEAAPAGGPLKQFLTGKGRQGYFYGQAKNQMKAGEISPEQFNKIRSARLRALEMQKGATAPEVPMGPHASAGPDFPAATTPDAKQAIIDELSQSGDPETQGFFQRLKNLPKGEAGMAHPGLLKFGTGAMGAAVGTPIGYNEDPSDPMAALKGALMGGALGYAGGSGIGHALETGGSAIGGAVKEATDWRNAGLLSSPMAQAKKVVSDIGTYHTNAVEKLLSGDTERGGAMLANSPLIHPMKTAKDYWAGLRNPELASEIAGTHANRGALGMIARPYAAAQNVLQEAAGRAGVSPEEIRNIAFLGKPQSAAGKWIMSAQNNQGPFGAAMRAVHPFARIGVNLGEAGFQRIPGVGYSSALNWEPQSTRLARSVMGAGAMGLGAAEGEYNTSQRDAGAEGLSPAMEGLSLATIPQYALPRLIGRAMTETGALRHLYNAIPGLGSVIPAPGPNDTIGTATKKAAKNWLDQMSPSTEWMNPSGTIR